MLMKIVTASKYSTGFFVILASLVTFQVCFAQPQSGSHLLLVEKDGKSGFIDNTGKVVIPFQYDRAYNFHEGLALVIVKGKKSFIDTSGRVVFEAKYDVIGEFSEGVCPVNVGEQRNSIGLITESGRWGYIDKTGKLVIPLKFTHAEEFSEGLAAVNNSERGAFIDHNARIVFEVPLWVTYGFHDGIVGVFYLGKLAYFDRTGKQISRQFGNSVKNHSFSEGLVVVEIDGKSGFMDQTGKMVIEPQFEDADDFSEGLAPVKVRGEVMTRCPREESGYRESFRMIWGYIDKTGKMVIPAQFASADSFSEGLAAVNSCDGGYFIDKTGKKIVLGNFSRVSPFVDGLARINVGVNENRMWGLIDKTGKMIWGPQSGW